MDLRYVSKYDQSTCAYCCLFFQKAEVVSYTLASAGSGADLRIVLQEAAMQVAYVVNLERFAIAFYGPAFLPLQLKVATNLFMRKQ